MKFAKLTASTAALLLSSSALVAQDASTQGFENVFIDVGGTAVLVPVDVALEACGLDESALQTVAQTRIDESGGDAATFSTQFSNASLDAMGQGGAAGTDTAAAGGDASTDMTGDAATADAGATTDAAAGTDTTATADASGGAAASTDTGAAAGTETTDTATADASGAAGQDATATGTETQTAAADTAAQSGADAAASNVENVEATAADTSTDASAGAGSDDPFLVLATCQIDMTRATELGVDMTRTGAGLGVDAATLGIDTSMTSQ